MVYSLKNPIITDKNAIIIAFKHKLIIENKSPWILNLASAGF